MLSIISARNSPSVGVDPIGTFRSMTSNRATIVERTCSSNRELLPLLINRCFADSYAERAAIETIACSTDLLLHTNLTTACLNVSLNQCPLLTAIGILRKTRESIARQPSTAVSSILTLIGFVEALSIAERFLTRPQIRPWGPIAAATSFASLLSDDTASADSRGHVPFWEIEVPVDAGRSA
jgi:hypothetical protein